jgi:hypothetical protein
MSLKKRSSTSLALIFKLPVLPVALALATSAACASAPLCQDTFASRPTAKVAPIPQDQNKPQITHGADSVKIDWTDLRSKVEDRYAQVVGKKVSLTPIIIVDGDIIPTNPAANSFTLPKTLNQRDYFLEFRDEKGIARHRTDLSLDESKNAQQIPSWVFKRFVDQGLKIKLPDSLHKMGIDEDLSNASIRLGYENIVWVLSPRADASVKNLVSQHTENLDVIPTFNENGEPVSVDLRDSKSGSWIAKGLKPKNFYFKVDAAFNGNCFFWDDMFVSLATVPHHPALARATIEFWLDVQKMNGGVIPREVRKSNLKSLWFEEVIRVGNEPVPNLQYTNPYLMHRVAEELYRYNPSPENLELLKRVSQSMEDYMAWIEKNRSVKDSHGNFIGFVTNALGSGGDTSRGERGNDHTPDSLRSGWIDLLAQQIDLHKSLVKHYRLFEHIEKEQGRDAEAATFENRALAQESRAHELDALMNSRYWDPQKKFYFDVIPTAQNGFARDLRYETIFGFWPLLSHSANKEQVNAMAAAALDPEKFGGRFPLTANARYLIPVGDSGEDGYWEKWAHWPSTAAVVVEGFRENGRPDIAFQLTVGFLRGMQDTAKDNVYEFYGETSSKDASGAAIFTGRVGHHGTHQTRGRFAGWGKVFPVYSMLNNIIGIDPQIDGHLRWNLLMPLKAGDTIEIHNLAYKGLIVKSIKLVKISDNEFQVTVDNSRKIDLELALFDAHGGPKRTKVTPVGGAGGPQMATLKFVEM